MARLPLFPLGLVLVPGLVLPLHVFEERYRALVRDLVGRPEPERVFGVVAIRQGREVGADGVGALHEVGCTARLRRVVPHAEGTYDLVTTGERRFRLHSTDATATPYLVGDVTWLDEDAPGGHGAASVLAPAVARGYGAYRQALAAVTGEPAGPVEVPADPAALAWTVTAGLVVDLEPRQALLAADGTAARLSAALALLRRETTLLRATRTLPAPELARQGWVPN